MIESLFFFVLSRKSSLCLCLWDNLIITFLDIGLIQFTLCLVPWVSWIFIFMPHQIWTLLVIIYLNNVFALSLFSSEIPAMCILVPFLVSHRSLRFCLLLSFSSFCSSDLVLFMVIFSSLAFQLFLLPAQIGFLNLSDKILHFSYCTFLAQNFLLVHLSFIDIFICHKSFSDFVKDFLSFCLSVSLSFLFHHAVQACGNRQFPDLRG